MEAGDNWVNEPAESEEERVIKALLRRIADPLADATEQLIRPTLQVRGSTGGPPSG